MKYFVPAIILLLLFVPLLADWPLPGSRSISSTFGEYRSGLRIHAGIDIRTPVLAMPVVAPIDGWVERLRVSPWGYGKVLYLRGVDGGDYIFAHLSGFAPGLAERVVEEQEKRRNYFVELWFSDKEFPFFAGDTIAFTGGTGIGRPHLHFEVRDADSHPTNPLELGFSPMPDTTPPVFYSLVVVPLDISSRVNGSLLPVEIPVFFDEQKKVYRLRRRIFASGNLGFETCVYDYEREENPNHLGVYSLSLSLEDSTIFSFSPVSFSYEDNADAGFLWDIDSEERFNRRFVRLFSAHPTDVGFTKGDGKINLSEEDSVLFFRVIASDIHSNSSSLFLPVHYSPPINIGSLERTESDTFLFFSSQPDTGFSVLVDGRRPDKLIRFEEGENRLGFILPDSISGETIKLFFPNSNRLFLSLQDAGNPFESRVSFDYTVRETGLFLFFEFEPQKPVEILVEKSGDTIKPTLFFQSADSVVAAVPIRAEGRYNVILRHCDISWNFTVDVCRLKAGKKLSLPGSAALYIPPGQSLLLPFSAFELQDTPAIAEDIVSPVVRFKSSLFPLKEPARLTLSPGIPLDRAGRRKLAVGRFWRGEWYFVSTGEIAYINLPGTFALILDTVPPVVIPGSIEDGDTLSYSPYIISALVRDNFSGFDNHCIPTMYIDEQFVPAEFDPESERLYYLLKEPLSPGEHTVSIVAVDRLGNRTECEMTFFIGGE
ncbi:MAG: hypothetical protein B6D65_04905 [candidate division Zixibacteria bacterium 4484_93]|nr:MAG: hypothetical protein B6D65_04905 [candidate division Zixibacteria bacterium 4484_93]